MTPDVLQVGDEEQVFDAVIEAIKTVIYRVAERHPPELALDALLNALLEVAHEQGAQLAIAAALRKAASELVPERLSNEWSGEVW